MSQQHHCCVYLGAELASYGFGNDHPFGPMRHHVFEQEFYKQSLQEKVDILPPQTIDQSILELFHTHDYVEQVKQQSQLGTGYLDQGDTHPHSLVCMRQPHLLWAQSVMQWIAL